MKSVLLGQGGQFATLGDFKLKSGESIKENLTRQDKFGEICAGESNALPILEEACSISV